MPGLHQENSLVANQLCAELKEPHEFVIRYSMGSARALQPPEYFSSIKLVRDRVEQLWIDKHLKDLWLACRHDMALRLEYLIEDTLKGVAFGQANSVQGAIHIYYLMFQ